jgi:hypothetical protein
LSKAIIIPGKNLNLVPKQYFHPARQRFAWGQHQRGRVAAGLAGRTKVARPVAGDTTAGSMSAGILLLYLLGHIFLALSAKNVPILATIHALGVLLLGLYWAWSPGHISKVVCVIAYIGAAEVLWRISGASLLWEFGKYSICLIALVTLCRRPFITPNKLPIIYFALLIPSALLTALKSSEWGFLRDSLSFNLSGPLALCLSTLLLSGIRLNANELEKVLMMILGPMVSIAAICVSGTVNLSSDYEFGTNSNFDTSGGFGPNQVSSILGLGLLAGYHWTQRQKRFSIRWILGSLLVLWFAAQATLTFSRTGLWIGIITIALSSVYMLKGNQVPMLLGTAMVVGIFYFAVFKSLDTFTGGKLSQRYAEKGFTRREDIAHADLQLALRHPFIGVGVGLSGRERKQELGVHGIPHTEFTRLLSEHGLSGLLSLGALVALLAASLKDAAPQERPWRTSFAAYGLLFMMVTGMRLAAPAMTMGLAMLSFSAARQQNRKALRSPRRGSLGFRPGKFGLPRPNPH